MLKIGIFSSFLFLMCSTVSCDASMAGDKAGISNRYLPQMTFDQLIICMYSNKQLESTLSTIAVYGAGAANDLKQGVSIDKVKRKYTELFAVLGDALDHDELFTAGDNGTHFVRYVMQKNFGKSKFSREELAKNLTHIYSADTQKEIEEWIELAYDAACSLRVSMHKDSASPRVKN